MYVCIVEAPLNEMVYRLMLSYAIFFGLLGSMNILNWGTHSNFFGLLGSMKLGNSLNSSVLDKLGLV